MRIVFTCTTSQRYFLFQDMMLSFYNTCKDVDLISKFYCIDDGSSKIEYGQMLRMFPKMKIHRSPGTGQLLSIQTLIAMVDEFGADYIFHTEDDWKFLIEDKIITKCLDIMATDDRIKQVTLRPWECMYVKHGSIDYRMHVYDPMDYKKDWDIIKYNDCTMGGLTLNPSLVDFKVFKECFSGITNDDPQSRTWDREVARRFWDAGYKRANLNGEYIEHTGAAHSRYPKGR